MSRHPRVPGGEPAEVASPCVLVCELDPTSGLCRGCLRSGPEIARWQWLDGDQRRALLTLLAARRRAAGPPG